MANPLKLSSENIKDTSSLEIREDVFIYSLSGICNPPHSLYFGKWSLLRIG